MGKLHITSSTFQDIVSPVKYYFRYQKPGESIYILRWFFFPLPCSDLSDIDGIPHASQNVFLVIFNLLSSATSWLHRQSMCPDANILKAFNHQRSLNRIWTKCWLFVVPEIIVSLWSLCRPSNHSSWLSKNLQQFLWNRSIFYFGGLSGY